MQAKERAIRARSQSVEKEDVEADVRALRAEKIGWIEEAVVNVYVKNQAFPASNADTLYAVVMHR